MAQGTQDARMHYHAGRIALARGDSAGARKHLETALTLNPFFDVKGPAEARDLLRKMDKGTAAATEGKP